MATIPGRNDGELIRTDWGDAVANELNGQCVKKTGSQTMAGPLTVTGAVATGSTMSVTGALFAGGQVAITPAAPTATTHATRKDYVDGLIGTRVATAGDTMTGHLYVGNVPSEANDGLALRTDGHVYSVITTGSAISVPNLIVSRAGTVPVGGALPSDIGGRFMRFDRGTAGLTVGTITVASASSVAYNTTSDPRLKEQTGDAADAADIVQALGSKVYRGRWIADQGEGEEWVFINSTDVEPVAAFAVQGEADAVDWSRRHRPPATR